MVRVLVFKKNGVTKELTNYKTKPEKNEIIWTHLQRKEDKYLDVLLDSFTDTQEREEFKEDLVEKQRPTMINFKNFTFLNVTLPTDKLLNLGHSEDQHLQMTFVITRNKIISVANRSSQTLSEIVDDMKKTSLEDFSASGVISYLLDDLVENSIEIMGKLKKKIDVLQRTMIQENGMKTVNEIYDSLEYLKETLFSLSKSLRADIEIIKNIRNNKGKFLCVADFDDRLETRFLYCADLIETQKTSLEGLNNLYIAAQSNQMSRQIFKLTWLGAFLLIPTIVSGFFGMNVELPLHDFWVIALVTVILSIIFAYWLRR